MRSGGEGIMDIQLNEHMYETVIKAYLKIFYPLEDLVFNKSEQPVYKIEVSASSIEIIYFAGNKESSNICLEPELCLIFELKEDKEKRAYGERYIKCLLYDLCTKITGIRPAWGVLQGIRPTKLAFKLINKYGSTKKVEEILIQNYKLESNKAKLLLEVLKVELPYLRETVTKHSIYIGIPFCPSRCSYCSFTSYSVDKWQDEYKEYVETLIYELTSFKEVFKHVRSLYIGGGTPTSLTESDFDKLLHKIRQLLGNQEIEFTVEAGRPDTITRNKLMSMKKYGVNRISINPQSLHDQTLINIGRNHTVEDIYYTFYEARELGFNHINMDLILGLPGETIEAVKVTIDKVIELGPESITVHTMALKRGTKLTKDKANYLQEMGNRIDEMLDYSYKKLKEAGYIGYYLYRQKNMVGNFENIGYCKKGCESIYNIHTMEEKESIIAFGAGAISKRVIDGKLKRLEHPKDVRTYLAKIDGIIEKAKKFWREIE